MKAEDLMIGDFIKLPDGASAKVISIARDGIYFEDSQSEGVASFDNLSPILITQEILEKNGFRFDGSGQRSMMLATPYGDSGTRWSIYVGLKHKTIEAHCAPPVERKPGWRKSNKACLEACGCFVHELQHALRLCGIDKEIIL